MFWLAFFFVVERSGYEDLLVAGKYLEAIDLLNIYIICACGAGIFIPLWNVPISKISSLNSTV